MIALVAGLVGSAVVAAPAQAAAPSSESSDRVAVEDIAAPTGLDLSNSAVAENSPTSTELAVGTFTSTDADTGASHTYSIVGGADADDFVIVGTELRFRAGIVLDYETQSSYTVRVRTTNSASATFERDVIVTLTDVNEAPVVAAPLADQVASVGTTFSYGVPAGAFADPDAGTSLSYSADLADGSALPAWLQFDPASRTFSGMPDADGAIDVRVTAGDGSLSVSDEFTLTISQVPPRVMSIVRAGGAAQSTSADILSFTVTFSEAVTGVDTNDFTLTGSGSARADVSAVQTADSITYSVTLTGVAGDGTLRLDLKASSTGITNASSAPIAGGYSSGQLYVLDNTAPAVPSLALVAASDSGAIGDGTTNVTTPALTGTADANSSIRLYDSDGTTVLGTAVAGAGAGVWSITSSTLSEGRHSLTVTATDAVGNVSSASTALVLVIDTTSPARPAITSAALTNLSAPTLTGTAEAGSRVTVSVAGATYATPADGGSWSVDLGTVGPDSGTLALDTDGANAVAVTATDVAGNHSLAGTQSLVIDVSAPVVTAVGVPADGTYSLDDALDFTLAFSEPVTVDTSGGTPQVSIVVGSSTIGASYVAGSGSTTLVFRAVVQGGWQDGDGITLGALTSNGGTLRDMAGNAAATTLNGVPSTTGVRVDALAPGAPTLALAQDTGVSASDGISRDGQIILDGLEAGATWAYSLDSGSTWAAGSGNTFGLAEGSYAAGAVRARLTDAAGNTGGPGLAGALVIDTTAPTDPTLSNALIRTGPGGNALVGTLTATDATGQAQLALASGDGDTDNGLFAVENGELLLVDPATAGVGARSVRIVATDLAGNTAGRAFVIDVVANLAPTITGVPDGERWITAGTAAPLDDVVLGDGDGDALTVVLTPTGGHVGGLQAGSSAGVDAVVSNGVWTLSGSAVRLTAVLAGLTFVADAAGSASLSIAVDDGHVTAAVTATYSLRAAGAQVIATQPVDQLDVVPGGSATFEVAVTDPAAIESVVWEIATSSVEPGPDTAWRAIAGAGSYSLAVPATVGNATWYRAVLTGRDGRVTVSVPARLTLWDVQSEVGANHDDLAARFPDAADLQDVVPGLRLSDLPTQVTFTLPWSGPDSAVTVFGYSAPTYLGTFPVTSGSVQISVTLEAGEHYLVLAGVDSKELVALHYDTTTGASPEATDDDPPVGLAATGLSVAPLAGVVALMVLGGVLLLLAASRARRRTLL